MLTPLKQWICDTCGQIIESPEHGWLEWRQDENHKAFDFRIVHHVVHSPYGPDGDCYQSDELHNHLTRFVGEDGLAYLLNFLDPGHHISPDYTGPRVSDMRGFVELIRRLHMQYYEEARQFFDKASYDGFFRDVNILNPKELKVIIKTYGTQPA